jgi:hypothetical protein
MRRTRTIAHAVALLAAAAALWAMQRSTPNYTRLLAAVETRAVVGEFARGRVLAVRVDGVDLAKTLEVDHLGKREFGSSGVWLIVHASASATREPARIGAAAIETVDGRRYVQSGRPTMGTRLLSRIDLQPDVVERGDLVFELPAAALAGAHLVVSAAPFGLAPMDSVLRIPLGLDDADVARRVAAPPPTYVLEKS